MKLTSYLKVTPASTKGAGLGFLLSAALLAPSYAGAQDVEEVIIQGEQMTDQVLDDLVSVSAIDAEKLADAGIENVEDVAAYVPNLVLTQSITGTNIFIRGIGSGVNQGFDQSVGLYADGVPLPRANMARSPFLDLAGVQVLRGPQYVLDGNFSIAGSVHMLSNLSLDEFKAGIDLNYQPAQNDRKILLTAGGPINDWFAINAVVQSKKSDGYMENVFQDSLEPGVDELTGRFVLGFNPTDNFSIKFKAERGSFDTTGRPIEVIFSEQSGRLDKTALTPIGFEITRDALVAGTLTATPWITESDYLLAPRDVRYRQGLVVDGVPTEQFLFAGNEYFSQWSEFYSDNGATAPTGLLDTTANYKRAADTKEFSNNDSINYTLVSDLWLNDSKLTSTSSYIEYSFDEAIDGDITPMPLLVINQSENYDQIYQALKFESPKGGFIELTAGASYLNSHLKFRDNINLEIDSRNIPPGSSLDAFDVNAPVGAFFAQFITVEQIQGFADFGIIRNFKQSNTIQAAFIQSTFNWSDVFRSTIGLRYTHSEKTAFKELYFTDKDFVDFDINVDPLAVGRESRTPNISEALLNSMEIATRDFVTFFGLQVHTDRYDVPNTGIDSAPLNEVRREETLLPSITFEWDITTDLTTLASVRLANKLGGFDARSNTRPDVPGGRGAPVGTFEFKDESALVYELGTKWFFPQGNGQLSATAFFSQFTNLQTSRSDGKVGANVTNAGAAETRGVEVEGFLALSEKFNMQYSLAWIDFEFTDFITGTCALNRRPDNVVVVIDAGGFAPDGASTGSVSRIAYEEVIRAQSGGDFGTTTQGNGSLSQPLPSGSVPFDDLLFGSPIFCDFNERTNQFVAEWQGTFTFNYQTEIAKLGVFKPTVDILYNSGYFTDVAQDADIAQEAYTQINGRLGLSDFDGRWTVAITGQNLTNETIIGSAAPVPIASGINFQRAYFGFIRPPRTIGLNLRYNFF